MVEAKRNIWKARENGTKQKIDDPQSVRQDVLFILNFLDSIAIGVREGVYLDTIVKDYLFHIILDAVNRFIKGGFGNFDVKEADLKGLMWLYNRFANADTEHRAV